MFFLLGFKLVLLLRWFLNREIGHSQYVHFVCLNISSMIIPDLLHEKDSYRFFDTGIGRKVLNAHRFNKIIGMTAL